MSEGFRPTYPADGPFWLRSFGDSVANLFRRIMPAPFRFAQFATADLPTAADYEGGVVYDTTENSLKFSDGSTWSVLPPLLSLSIVNNQNAQTGMRVDNPNTGTSASALFDFRNGALGASDRLLFGVTGTGYTAVTGWQDAAIIAAQANLSGGLRLGAVAAAGISFEVGGNGSASQVGSITTSSVNFTIPMAVSAAHVVKDLDSTGSSIAASLLFRGSDDVTVASIGRNSGSANLVYDGTGVHEFRVAGVAVSGLSATAFSCPSSTTASAANVHQASSGAALLRSTSSLRYKQDVDDIPDGVADLVLSLRPVTYRSKAEADDPDRLHWGFIAEEVAEVIPTLVHYDGEGQPDGMQYERVIVGLLSVVKRLEARVSALEATID
jgi:hypothetical protein